MLFTIITILSALGLFAGLAFHRFWTTREEARSTIIYVEIFKKYLAWLALRTIQSARKASPKAWWDYVKALSLWRLPDLEKWLFVGFYGSFAYLAASGFFFAIFVPRGLFQRFFGLSFITRPLFKVVLAVCAFVIGALVFLAGLLLLGRLAGFLEKRSEL